MSTIVSALWKYAGYNSLCRSLFDAGEHDLAEDKSHASFLQESRNEPASPVSSTGASISDDDSEGLRAWAYHLSSDEEEEEEEEGEEEEDRDREDYLHEISLSDDDDEDDNDYDYESDGLSF